MKGTRNFRLRTIKQLNVQQLLKQNPFIEYTNEYPNNASFREFSSPQPIADIWRKEDTSHLTLNITIPYLREKHSCRNIFNKIYDPDDLHNYLEVLERQSEVINYVLKLGNPMHFDRITIGNGDLSLLSPSQLNQTLDFIENIFTISFEQTKLSIEMQPICSEEFLNNLLDKAVHRISLRVHSFIQKDLKRLSMSSSTEQNLETIDLIVSMGFPHLNFDLVYGIADQSERVFLSSIEKAINYEPDELNLYPFYRKTRTRSGEMDINYDQDVRSELYIKGRERILDAGYYQDSMRRFVKKRSIIARGHSLLQDRMVGIGWGSRSNTANIHYSDPYSIIQSNEIGTVNEYNTKSPMDFQYATHGIQLTEDDKRRRFIIMSLQKTKGMDTDSYRRAFKAEPQKEFPELLELIDNGLVHKNGSFLVLTDTGIALSDIICPWLYSEYVIDLIEENDSN